MNTLEIAVRNPNGLLTALGAGAVIQIQRSPTGGGLSYVDVATVPLVADTTSYEYEDVPGLDGEWYRLRYENSTGDVFGSWGPEFQTPVAPEIPATLTSPGPQNAYMTPQRFRGEGLGVNLTKYSDFELGSILEDASALVDAHCNVPLLPGPHSFLGGIVLDEEHAWKFSQTMFDRGTRRVYLKHWPIISIESLVLVVGSEASGEIPMNTLVINNAERWVEVTALTIANSAGLFGVTGWVVPMGGLTVPIAKASYTYGWSLAESDEPLRPYGLDNIYQAAHGLWTADPVTVKVAGSTVLTGFTIDRSEGRITFTDPPVGTVTAAYVHRLPRDISRATALVAADLVADANIRRRGLAGLASLRVNEIEARMPAPRSNRTGSSDEDVIPPRASALLTGYRYWSQA